MEERKNWVNLSLPQPVYDALKARAGIEARSMTKQAIVCLAQALGVNPAHLSPDQPDPADQPTNPNQPSETR